MTFKDGDIVILRLHEDDAFNGKLATVIQRLHDDDLFGGMYEIEVIDKTGLEETFDVTIEWDDVGLGLVLEDEMELAE